MNQVPVRKRWRDIDGVLLLDKPGGMSSNDALQKARRLFSAAKAGHTGTLDPMATGLLPLCFGEATKFSNRLLEADKTYHAVMRLGQVSSTGDAEGEILRERPVAVDETGLLSVCETFLGEIDQLPPMYSALKHQGKALYEYARAGVEIERETRRVKIRSLNVLGRQGNDVAFSVCSSKGTYVRTLAEDIGEALGCGAHLVELRRTAIGGISVQDALSLDALAAMDEPLRFPLLAPPEALLAHLPEIHLDESSESGFMHGQAVRLAAIEGEFRIYGSDDVFLGLGFSDGQGSVRPVRLLASRVKMGAPKTALV